MKTIINKILCLIYHDYHIHCYTNNKGNIITFSRQCQRCNKEQTLQKPIKYDPCRYYWIDYKHKH